MNKQKRLFFAVNLPEETKIEIGETILAEIPKEKWRKVKPENCHITMRFLGYLPLEAIRELEKKTLPLQDFDCFEAELCSVGHFKNKVLWVGIGTGTQELNLLSKKLCSLLGVQEGRFHPHATLARNRGSGAKETDTLIENLRKKDFKKKIFVQSLDLMESILHTSGPEYRIVFSEKFSENQ